MRQIKKVAITTISAALALTLTSCTGAGPDAATRMINRVTDGAEAVIDTNGYDIRMSNLLLVATGDSTTVLVGHIVNRSEEQDQLLAITTRTTQGVITGQTILNANQPIHFEGSSANAKRPSLLFIHGGFHGAWCWDEYLLPWFAARGWHAPRRWCRRGTGTGCSAPARGTGGAPPSRRTVAAKNPRG